MATKTTASTVRFLDAYNTSYKVELKKELKRPNVNNVPKLEKIVINVGLGKAKDDKKLMEVATNIWAKANRYFI